MEASFIRAFFALDLPVENKQRLSAAMDALKLHLKREFKSNPRWFPLPLRDGEFSEGRIAILPSERKHKHKLCLGAASKQLSNPFRWVRPQNLHLTLQFLGQVKKTGVAKLLQQVGAELKGFKPFYLSLGSLEWFPSSYRPRVLSLKAGPPEVLAELSLALAKRAAALNYAIEDRPFRAHVTLARAEGLGNVAQGVLSAFEWPELPDILVKEIVLFKSEIQKEGTVYERVGGVELG